METVQLGEMFIQQNKYKGVARQNWGQVLARSLNLKPKNAIRSKCALDNSLSQL